ncbi:MAG: TIM barrel protein [Candidatus Omnitrophota bacterium]
MINFGIRQSFEKIEQFEERFSNLNVPVELALPYYWDIYEPIRSYLKEISEKIKTFHVNVLSVHAVQAPITNEEFEVWGKETADFAKALGAKVVTLHPNNANKTRTLQDRALKSLERLRFLYRNEVIFSIETFSGKRRIFTADEIANFKLPMTLDVAHLENNKVIWRLLETYLDHIVCVHLSSKGNGKHHLPIDSFCKEVVKYLIEDNWGGNVILEYLPEFRDNLLSDLKLITSFKK